MSRLHANATEDRMHHQDNSHRWTAPQGVDQATWTGLVKAHLEAHRRAGWSDAAQETPVDDAEIRLATTRTYRRNAGSGGRRAERRRA